MAVPHRPMQSAALRRRSASPLRYPTRIPAPPPRQAKPKPKFKAPRVPAYPGSPETPPRHQTLNPPSKIPKPPLKARRQTTIPSPRPPSPPSPLSPVRKQVAGALRKPPPTPPPLPPPPRRTPQQFRSLSSPLLPIPPPPPPPPPPPRPRAPPHTKLQKFISPPPPPLPPQVRRFQPTHQRQIQRRVSSPPLNRRFPQRRSSLPSPKVLQRGELQARYRRRLLRLVNAVRDRHGVPHVMLDDTLTACARRHNADLAFVQERLSHAGADGAGLSERLKRCGYLFRYASENVARGQGDPQHVIRSWMKSPGHRKNLISPRVTHMGVHVGRGKDGRLYWAQMFGLAR